MSRINPYKIRLIKGGADTMAHAVAMRGDSKASISSALVRDIIHQEDKLMVSLSECGKRLTDTLEISDEMIEKALKELREECWK